MIYDSGPGSEQAQQLVALLIDANFPTEKLAYYRGGMQVWAGLGLSFVETTIMSQDPMSPKLTTNLSHPENASAAVPSFLQRPQEAASAAPIVAENRIVRACMPFAAIGVFAFVVGSLVTYQIARATLQPTVQIVEVPVEADTPSVENIVTRLEASNVLTAPAAPQVETGNVTTAEPNTTDTARDAQVALMRKAAARISSVGGAATLQQAITNGAVSEVNRGRDTVEVEELLRNAANNGLIQVPDGLVDSRGSVDTRSLLLSLVEQAVDECDGLTSNCGNAAVSNAAFKPNGTCGPSIYEWRASVLHSGIWR